MKNRMRSVSLFADIRRSLPLCASISIIVMLGVFFYTGIAFSAQGIRDTMGDYFRGSRFHDVKVLSANGFTDEDVALLETLPDIGEVEGAFAFDAYLDRADEKRVVSVQTLTKKLDIPELLDGRLPVGDYECAIDEELLEQGVELGDELTLEFARSPLSAALSAESWRVTGVIRHPASCLNCPDRRGISTLGSGRVQSFVFIDPAAVQSYTGTGTFGMLTASFAQPVAAYTPELEETAERVRGELETLRPDWHVFGQQEALPYIAMNIAAENLSRTGYAFSWLFIGIAIIVCYTSFGRLINERRGVIGAQKALGFRTGELVVYYLFYAFFCALPGALAGVAGGYWIFQPLLVSSYTHDMLISGLQSAFLFSESLWAVLISIAVILVSAMLPVLRLLRRPAVELMRPGGTGGGGLFRLRARLSRRKVSVRRSATLLNIISDPNRLLSTVVGMAGCTALILIGLSMRYGLSSVPELQYEQIMRFDRVLTVEPGADEVRWRSILSEHGLDNAASLCATACTFESEQTRNTAIMIISGDPDFTDYYALSDPYTGEALSLPEDGVLLSVRTCEYYGIAPGDMLTLTQADGTSFEVRVAGAMDNYLGHMLVLDAGYYESVSGRSAGTNQFYIRLDGAEDIPIDLLAEEPDYVSYISADYQRAEFDGLAASLNMIVTMMIALSAALAVIVLYQLHKLTMDKKTGELAVMYANGFTGRELRSYVTVENNILTALGLPLGVLTGLLLSGNMIDTLESDSIKVYDGFSLMACVISVGLTGLFAVLIEQILLRRWDPQASFQQKMRQRNE